MHESNNKKNFINETFPMVKLREAENWAQIGFKTLSQIQFVNLLKIFEKEGV